MRIARAARYDCGMRAFDVRLNGEKLCLAGISGNGVANTIVDYVAGENGERLHLTVGGLRGDGGNDEFVIWRSMFLKFGDEITLRIVEADQVDRPRKRTPRDPKQDERNAKAYVRRMAKEFGWTITTSRRGTGGKSV
jgi:hypothetical protein